MEIIKINSKALKVILNDDECRNYDFIHDGDVSDEIFQASIDSLISTVEEAEGVSLADKSLLIQVYPLKGYGCEIYICDTEEGNMYKDKGAQGAVKRNSTYTGVYRFDSLEQILTVCNRLSSITDDDGAMAFYDEETECYYLICRGISSKELRFSFINEYAKQLKPSYAHYVKEHLKCFCNGDAIKILSKLL